MCLEHKDFSIMPCWKWKLNLSVIYQNCLPWTLTTITSILCPLTVPSLCWFSQCQSLSDTQYLLEFVLYTSALFPAPAVLTNVFLFWWLCIYATLALPCLLASCCCSVAKSCSMLCNSNDCSAPGFSVHGILQARILECVVISFSRESSWPRDQTCISW